MSATFTLGRIRGISIGLNWSLLVVVTLLVWTLAAAVFPERNPGLGEPTYMLMALAAVPLFFVSILLHELGHAFRAQREGVAIEEITLWIFGGVALLKERPQRAGSEFRIALAGPLVSLALGLAFVLAAALLRLPAAVDGVVAWLGYVNLALLAFNLVPALPLDGGRILRAALWHTRRDLRSATATATAVARTFAFGFITLGIALAIVQGTFTGIWFAFIGWFVLTAAEAEATQVAVADELTGLIVRDVMTPDPVTVTPELTLESLVDEVVRRSRHTSYPVVSMDGQILGLIPFRAVAGIRREAWGGRMVGERMLPLSEVAVLDPELPLEEALPALAGGTRRALVVDDRGLAGIVSPADLARGLASGRQRSQAEQRSARSAPLEMSRRHRGRNDQATNWPEVVVERKRSDS